LLVLGVARQGRGLWIESLWERALLPMPLPLLRQRCLNNGNKITFSQVNNLTYFHPFLRNVLLLFIFH
jgi:hypothetical protein